ncbi:hypothetical protein DFJ74DRAFT_664217 [Hyaloraphidium curvatum]|nr:hypothetical protein DFJ74DRAFT_664217 [Hyaloraphidium curvatum]
MPPLALPDSVDACPNLEQWTLVARRPPLRTELAPFPRAVALLKVLDWRATDLYRSPDAFFAHENFLPREVRLATARHWLPACASKPIELLELGRADPEQLLGPLPATLRVLRLVEPRRIVRGLGERVKEALEARRGTRIKVRWCRHDVRFWRSVRNAVVYA